MNKGVKSNKWLNERMIDYHLKTEFGLY